jgi:hypothetical protein
MKRESRTVDRCNQFDSPTERHLSLVDLLVGTRAELMELAVNSGMKVLHTILEEDRTAICGPRYQHQADRTALRPGTVSSGQGPVASCTSEPFLVCTIRRARTSSAADHITGV